MYHIQHNYRAHSMAIFTSLSVLTVYDIYLLQCAIHMFLCHNNSLPESILNHYKLNNTTHNYSTRNSNNFHLPLIRTSSFRKSIFFHGPQVWNSIPQIIKECKTLNSFRKTYKRFLLNIYSETGI